MKKMTMVEKFGAIKALLNGENPEGFSVADAMEFLDDRIEKVNAKNAKGGDRKPTKNQVKNEGIKDKIVEVLHSATAPMSATDVGKELGLSCSKASALLAQMLVERNGVANPDGCVVRTEVKGKAFFALANK